MMIRQTPRIGAVFLVLLSITSVASAHEPHCKKERVRYEAIEVGTFGADGGYVQAINNRGQLTGAASVSNDIGRAFVWDCATGMNDIGALADTDYASIGTFINDRGTIVGQSFSETDAQIFIWNHATGMRAIQSGFPLSLNDRNDVTFWGSGGLFLWNEATGPTLVSDLSGLILREALVNNWRQLGGYGATVEPESPAGYYSWSSRRGARFLAESTFARDEVYDFNDRGELLVNNYAGTHSVPSIVKPDGTVQLVGTGETGTFVEALAFNNRGQVVGFRFTGAEPQRQLFLWTADQGFRDLNVLMLGHSPTDADARITSVADINDWGWIAGAVRAPGATYANPALLVPVSANAPWHRDLSRLQGPQLCKHLQTLKARALLRNRSCR